MVDKGSGGRVARATIGATRVAGRRVFRALGTATGGWRDLPDFLVVGTKRGGTTSLFRYLLEHPDVLPLFPSARRLPLRADTKGVRYFDRHYQRGDAWYRGHFPSRATRRRASRHGRRIAVGEATPYYLFHPLAARRAARVVPDARIVVLLRDPVERAWSHHKERRRAGVEPLDFAEALAAEPGRLAGEEERLLQDPGYHSVAHEHLSYVAQGEYRIPLERWLDHFGERVLVLRSEQFYADPQSEFDAVTGFLGLAPHRLEDARVWNATERTPMPPAVRQRLEDHFGPHQEALDRLLGRELGGSR